LPFTEALGQAAGIGIAVLGRRASRALFAKRIAILAIDLAILASYRENQ